MGAFLDLKAKNFRRYAPFSKLDSREISSNLLKHHISHISKFIDLWELQKAIYFNIFGVKYLRNICRRPIFLGLILRQVQSFWVLFHGVRNLFGSRFEASAEPIYPFWVRVPPRGINRARAFALSPVHSSSSRTRGHQVSLFHFSI